MVYLEGRDMGACLEDQMRNGTQSGADLPDVIASARLQERDDALPGFRRDEEVLAELLRHRKPMVREHLADFRDAAVIEVPHLL